jgi:hypothetical protein
MNQKQPPWQREGEVQVLRLYKTAQHGDWPQNVNKSDLHPDWPRIVVLDLKAEEFAEFDRDPLGFAQNHNLFPEQPIVWMSQCAKPPFGEKVPLPADGSGWTVIIVHGRQSLAACAACPQELMERCPNE